MPFHPASRLTEEKLITSTQRVGLLLFPFTNRYKGITDSNLMKVKRIDATSSVKSMSYSKSKSDASGVFSIVMTSDQNWSNIVRPGEWLMLYQSNFKIGIKGRESTRDTTEGLRCLGNIDRVSRQKVITNDGQKIYTYRIDGRDFGKVFEKISFYYNPYTPEEVQNIFVTYKSGLKIIGDPASFIKSYVQLYLGDNTIVDATLPGEDKKRHLEELDQLRIPEDIIRIFGKEKATGRLSDILEVDIPKKTDLLYPEGYSWYIPNDRALNGDLWSILKSVTNETMNEMYLSMKYNAEKNMVLPTLTLRKIPFKNGVYSTLPKTWIQENMIISDDMGFNDHERSNCINLDAVTSLIGSYPQFMAANPSTITDKDTKKEVPLFPYIRSSSIRRYGMQPRSFQSEWIQPQDINQANLSQLSPFLKLASDWMRDLIEWWGEYERYESGVMLIKGFSEENVVKKGGIAQAIPNDQYNIGNNIYINHRDRLYHLEGFAVEWSAPAESHVNLTLTRGVAWNEAERQKLHKFIDEVETDGEELPVSVVNRKDK